jgi:hypothetical protein
MRGAATLCINRYREYRHSAKNDSVESNKNHKQLNLKPLDTQQGPLEKPIPKTSGAKNLVGLSL